MRQAFALFGMLAAAVAGTTSASAYSPEDLEAMPGDKEKYLQPIDKEAPELELQDADGRQVRLSELQGKVVVLHFIYAGCPDVGREAGN